MDQEKRIYELEDLLRQLDRLITELIEERELVSKLPSPVFRASRPRCCTQPLPLSGIRPDTLSSSASRSVCACISAIRLRASSNRNCAAMASTFPVDQWSCTRRSLDVN